MGVEGVLVCACGECDGGHDGKEKDVVERAMRRGFAVM